MIKKMYIHIQTTPNALETILVVWIVILVYLSSYNRYENEGKKKIRDRK